MVILWHKSPKLSNLENMTHLKVEPTLQTVTTPIYHIIIINLMESNPLQNQKKGATFNTNVLEEKKPQRQRLRDSDEESFQPEYHQIKKMGLKLNKKNLKVGGWTCRQNKVYMDFMINNPQDFKSEKNRRTSKVFFRLSKILKKRTPDQCRSHHQKLQMKHGDNLTEIIAEVQKKIQKSYAEELVNQQMKMNWKGFLPPPFFTFARKPLGTTAADEQEDDDETLLDWYRIRTQANVIKIEINTAFIQEWQGQ